MKSLKSLILGILVLMFCIGNVGKVYADRVDDLIKKLRDENSFVRAEAAAALGRIGDKRAIEPLKKVAKKDSNKDVRKAAKEALKNIQKK